MALDAAPAPDAPAHKVRLYLIDGQELACELLSQSKDKVTVRIGGGAPFDISRASIRVVEDASAEPSPANYFRDPNITRTFYAPTGFRLRQGELYFSQKELVFSSFGYGVTDNLSVMVGSMLPFWFISSGQNLIAGAKLGMDAGDVWHLAVGAQGLLLPAGVPGFSSSSVNPAGGGMVFGTVTCGTPLYSLTISAGEAMVNVMGNTANTPIVVVSASSRVAQNVALEMENWFFPGISGPSTEPFLMFNSAGVRLMNEHLAADLGFIRAPGSFIPVPWVDFTYTFPG
jgi:hypothetical protein